jgi:glutathione S-transferase
MAQYVEVEDAMKLSGLRVVLSPGVPGPWSESAKGILHVKKLPYVKVRQNVGGTNEPLRRWTAQETAPAFVYNDERPRSLWNDQLFLVERLAPNPALIPPRPDERTQMFGLANELCGENGFGWSRRMMLIHRSLVNPNVPTAARKGAEYLGRKYDYSLEAAEAAPRRCAEILQSLARQLENQQGRGSRFLIGDQFSAVDIYWACFAALVRPLPDDLCPMPQGFRKMYTCDDPTVMSAVTPTLLEHRDFIYREYLELPVDL